MKILLPTALALLCAAAHPVAQAACYMVLDAGGQVVYRATLPPVNMELPLHATVPALVPGGKMVFWPSDAGCESEIYNLPRAQPVAARETRSAPAGNARR
jgi:hypothetical protein